MRPRITLLAPDGREIKRRSSLTDPTIVEEGNITRFVDVRTISISEALGRTINTCSFEIQEQRGSDDEVWKDQILYEPYFDIGIDVEILDMDENVPLPASSDEGDRERDLRPIRATRWPISRPDMDVNGIVDPDTGGDQLSSGSEQEAIRPADVDGKKILFRGVITLVEEKITGINRRWIVTAQDYTMLLSRAFALPEEYVGFVSRDIIQDVFRSSNQALETQSGSINVFDFDVNVFVERGFQLPNFRPSRMQMDQFMDNMAGESAYEWYVDYNKYIHFFRPPRYKLGFILTDGEPNLSRSPYRATYTGFTRTNDGLQLANYIEIVGRFVYQESSEYISRNSGQPVEDGLVRFPATVPWEPLPNQELPSVFINRTGTANLDALSNEWTSLPVIEAGSPEATTSHVQWSSGGPYLLVPNAIVNSLPQAISSRAFLIRGQADRPIRVGRSAEGSREYLGRFFTHRIYDETIQTLDQANLRLIREIRDRQFGETQMNVVLYHSDMVDLPRTARSSEIPPFLTLSVGREVKIENKIAFVLADPTLYNRTPNQRTMFVDKIDIAFLGGEEVTYTLTLKQPFVDIRTDRTAQIPFE